MIQIAHVGFRTEKGDQVKGHSEYCSCGQWRILSVPILWFAGVQQWQDVPMRCPLLEESLLSSLFSTQRVLGSMTSARQSKKGCRSAASLGSIQRRSSLACQIWLHNFAANWLAISNAAIHNLFVFRIASSLVRKLLQWTVLYHSVGSVRQTEGTLFACPNAILQLLFCCPTSDELCVFDDEHNCKKCHCHLIS